MFRIAPFFLFLIIALLCFEKNAEAQLGNLTRYEFRAGFYGGPSMYIGQYNPWRFGDAFTYGDPETSTASYGGELNYGAFMNVRLTPRIFFRANLEFGNLRYEDDDINYLMSTPYTTSQILFDFKGNPYGKMRPYMSLGYGIMNFTVPKRNTHPEFIASSPSSFGSSERTRVIPITFGLEYHITERTALFAESGFHLTGTDMLDNFTPAESGYSLSNDAFMSFRFGFSMEILRRSNLPVRISTVEAARDIDRQADIITVEALPPDMFEPVPVDTLIAERLRAQREAELAEQRAMEEAERLRREEAERQAREEAERLARIQRERDLAVRDSIRLAQGQTPVIRIVEPEERAFTPERAEEEMEELRTQRQRLAELGEIDLSQWDPTVPVVITTPNPVNRDMVDESGIAITAPPQGYYVQVYASVGPITATRARDMAINALGDILEDPNRQVIITRRQQFYEVRIGVFDSYDDTLAVLREIQGTFIDSYTLIYIPRVL